MYKCQPLNKFVLHLGIVVVVVVVVVPKRDNYV